MTQQFSPHKPTLQPSQHGDKDYVICHRFTGLSLADKSATFDAVLVYVPDRHTLSAGDIRTLVLAHADNSPKNCHLLLSSALEDFCNLVVPHFARLWLTMRHDNNASTIMSAQDINPLWDNSAVLQQVEAVERQALL